LSNALVGSGMIGLKALIPATAGDGLLQMEETVIVFSANGFYSFYYWFILSDYLSTTFLRTGVVSRLY